MGDDRRQRFEAVFREHFDAVLRYARHRSDPESAKDVAAHTFTVAWRRVEDMPDNALPWLLGIARRALAEHRRSARRRLSLFSRAASQERRSAGRDPGEHVADRDELLSAFAALRPADREVLMLVAWDGLSPADAATVLGCSPATFAVRLSRARARLGAAAETPPAPRSARPIPLETP